MNWRNSKLQAFNFLFGGCFTFDGAIHKAWGNYKDRENTIASVEARKMEAEANLQLVLLDAEDLQDKHDQLLELFKFETDEQRIKDIDKHFKRNKIELYKLAAKLVEARAHAEDNLRSYSKAVEECETLRSFINDLLPHAKYDWLNDMDGAAEKAQLEEWTYELASRAIDMLATTGTIGYDHLQTMKTMPTYYSVILPLINQCKKIISEQGHLPAELLLTNHTIAHRFFHIAPENTYGDLPDFKRILSTGMENYKYRDGDKDTLIRKNPVDLLPARAPIHTPLQLPMNLSSKEAFQLDREHFQPKALKEIEAARKLLEGPAPESAS